MSKKYFVAYAVMNSTDLRANLFYHSCIILLEADSDENDTLILPLRVKDSYSFYSHNVPYKKSFFEEPLAFFTQSLGQNFRFRGSFGEWRRENIHDLTYGKGLTGRVFEINVIQFNQIRKDIHKAIYAQNKFLSQAGENVIDQEEYYKNYARNQFLTLVKNGVSPEEAAIKTKNLKPIPEFNSFPLSGGAYSCKVATLEKIIDCYDETKDDQKNALDYINQTLKGSFLESFIPRLTNDLEEMIIHSSSDQWVSLGEKNKYPFSEWTEINKDSPVFVVTMGSWYMDKEGNQQPLYALSESSLRIIKSLKLIGRLFELNMDEAKFKEWHNKVSHYLNKFSVCNSPKLEKCWANYADKFLDQLINSDEFNSAVADRVPANLQKWFDATVAQYEQVSEDETFTLAAGM